MSWTRRDFLRAGAGGVGAGVFAPALAACGSSNAGVASGGPNTAAFQLSWVKNVEWGGTWIAENRGYYRAQGLDLTVSAGGPEVSVEPRLAANRCLVGMTYGVGAASANENGAHIKIIGNQYQKSPSVFVSAASKPLTTPQDLIGHKLGVNNIALPAIRQFFAANKIPLDKVTIVPVQSSFDPLVNGQVDAQFGYITATATLDLKGFKTAKLFLSDYGYGDVTNAYGVTQQTLDTHRDEVVHFMRAEIHGWQDFVADPGLGARLTVNNYAAGTGLQLNEQTIEAQQESQLVGEGDLVKRKGLMWISPATKELVLRAVAGAGIKTTEAALFDDSVLAEVYQGKNRV